MHIFHKFYKTLQHATQLYTTLTKTLQNSTKLYKTLHYTKLYNTLHIFLETTAVLEESEQDTGFGSQAVRSQIYKVDWFDWGRLVPLAWREATTMSSDARLLVAIAAGSDEDIKKDMHYATYYPELENWPRMFIGGRMHKGTRGYP